MVVGTYLLLGAIIFAVPFAIQQFFFCGKKPTSIPWGPSGRHGLIAALESAFRTFIDIQTTLLASCALPVAQSSGIMLSSIIDGALLVLPFRHLEWLSSLPEDTLSSIDSHEERLQSTYTMPAATLTDPDIAKLAIRVLMRHTKGTIPEVHDELIYACDRKVYGGYANESLCLSHELLRLLTSTTNRMLVGLPLCMYQSSRV